MPLAAIVRQAIRQMRAEEEAASPSLDVLLQSDVLPAPPLSEDGVSFSPLAG